MSRPSGHRQQQLVPNINMNMMFLPLQMSSYPWMGQMGGQINELLPGQMQPMQSFPMMYSQMPMMPMNPSQFFYTMPNTGVSALERSN